MSNQSNNSDIQTNQTGQKKARKPDLKGYVTNPATGERWKFVAWESDENE
jgi:hypothetical protein